MKTKIAIGCLVQWFEADMIEDYFSSLFDSIQSYEGEVLCDIVVVSNEDLEKCISSKVKKECLEKINTSASKFNFNIREVREDLYTIADYRRDFNRIFCELSDIVVWGESDMLVPLQMFTILDSLNSNVNTSKYIATFGICKMWDKSWEPLEHIEFTDKPFIEGDNKNWWNIPYTMTVEEMNQFNSKVENLQVTQIQPHKFNGCGLVISSEVIKAGVNIPLSSFFIHEDTSFMIMVHRVLGNIPQYHFKNILLVHNRKHPNKRNYVKGEDKEYLDSQRRSNKWYSVANKMCESNNRNLFNTEYKSYTWEDVWKSLN